MIKYFLRDREEEPETTRRWRLGIFCRLTKRTFLLYCWHLKERKRWRESESLRQSERERTSSLRKLPSALLHHCRSASPSSSPGCPPLDTLNWIPVRCAASPWVSFLRVTEHAVCVYECASVCVCTPLCVKKLSSFPYKKLPTQNDIRTQTNMHTCAHIMRATDTVQGSVRFRQVV